MASKKVISEGKLTPEQQQFGLDEDMVPRNSTTYTKQEYWDYRFKEEAEYEWLASYAQLAKILAAHVRPTDRILTIGCGNSPFSAAMYDAGYHHIVNTDFSDVVIERQSALHSADRPEMTWQVMDMRKLAFDAASFDVVIDKAGMDAILAGRGDTWEQPDDLLAIAREVCESVFRVLKPGGVFLQVSFSQPHFRRPYIATPDLGWTLAVHKVDVGLGYFCYALTKPAVTAAAEPELPVVDAAAAPPTTAS